MSTKDPPIEAIVTVIHKDGHRGPYFEAKCEIGMVTVSLSEGVWLEEVWPEGGIKILLWDIRQKRKGWRAYKARFFRPGDERFREEKKHE